MRVKCKDWSGRDVDESVTAWVERTLWSNREGAVEAVLDSVNETTAMLGRLVEALGDAGVLSPSAILEVVRPCTHDVTEYVITPDGDHHEK